MDVDKAKQKFKPRQATSSQASLLPSFVPYRTQRFPSSSALPLFPLSSHHCLPASTHSNHHLPVPFVNLFNQLASPCFLCRLPFILLLFSPSLPSSLSKSQGGKERKRKKKREWKKKTRVKLTNSTIPPKTRPGVPAPRNSPSVPRPKRPTRCASDRVDLRIFGWRGVGRGIGTGIGMLRRTVGFFVSKL